MQAPTDTPGATYSLKSAATAAGVSVSTVRRRKSALIEAGATVTETGWTIPASALRAVFPATVADASHGSPDGTPVDAPDDSQLVRELRDQIAWLRQQVEEQNRTIARQAEAHAVIAAKLTQQLEGAEPAEPTASAPTEPPEQPTPRRQWWQRFGL